MSQETDAADDAGSHADIDIGDPAAVRRWCEALRVTDEALLKAVQTVGTRVDRVKDYLTAGSAGEQSDG